VNQTDAPSKAALLAALRECGDEFLARLRALPDEQWEQGRYENGWTARQILAHVAAIEWTYPRLLEIAASAPTTERTANGLPTRTAGGGIDAYNARQVEKRAETPAIDLLAEFERNRAATIAAVAAADEARLATPIRSAGGVTGPLALVLQRVAVDHVRGHLRDILGGDEPR
jgi:uncharacterized damage-inducible protein DinB